MKEQIAIQHLLRSNLVELQSKNHRYSLRSYAGKVGVHVGALSSIMNGKRNVSKDLAERIARRLLVDPQKRAELLDLFPETKRIKKESDNTDFSPRYLELEATKFKMISEWEHFAVLSLIKTKDFKDNVAWIAERLGITETRAQDVVDRLIEVELVKRDQSYHLVRTNVSLRTSDDTANLSLRKSHENTLELANESLSRDEIHERDFASVTMAIDPRNISVAKEMIRKFQDELAEVLESGNQTEVYRFSTQLFPLTKLKLKKVTSNEIH
jgi:uncharacterized protein (TIGR02147 family)